jgi:hypothetical protein
LKEFGLILTANAWSFIPHVANDTCLFSQYLNPYSLPRL